MWGKEGSICQHMDHSQRPERLGHRLQKFRQRKEAITVRGSTAENCIINALSYKEKSVNISLTGTDAGRYQTNSVASLAFSLFDFFYAPRNES